MNEEWSSVEDKFVYAIAIKESVIENAVALKGNCDRTTVGSPHEVVDGDQQMK